MSRINHDGSKDEESRTALVVGIAVAFAAASTLVMALRFYTRFVISKVAGWDDWTMLAAQVLSIAVSVLKCAGTLKDVLQLPIHHADHINRGPFWLRPSCLDGIRF